MKTKFAAVSLLAAVAALTPATQARDHGWVAAGSFIAGVALGHAVTRAAEPVVVYQQPVYVTTAPVVALPPPRVCVAPPPVVVYPAPVYYYHVPPPVCAPVRVLPRPYVHLHVGFGRPHRRHGW